MKKIMLSIEIEINEEELKEIDNYKNDYERDMTVTKWIDDLKIVNQRGDRGGTIEIGSEIEQYFNENIGESKVINSAKIVGIKHIE